MAQWYRHPRFWLALILAVIVVVSIALWLYDARRPDSTSSPVPTPMAAAESPLPTPVAGDVVSPPPTAWTNGGAILFWVALGFLLSLGITFILLRWYRQTA